MFEDDHFDSNGFLAANQKKYQLKCIPIVVLMRQEWNVFFKNLWWKHFFEIYLLKFTGWFFEYHVHQLYCFTIILQYDILNIMFIDGTARLICPVYI